MPNTCAFSGPHGPRGAAHLRTSLGLPLLLSHPLSDCTHHARHLGLPGRRHPQAWLLKAAVVPKLGLPQGGRLPPAQCDSGVGFGLWEVGANSRYAWHDIMTGHSPLPLVSSSINRNKYRGLIAVSVQIKKNLRPTNSCFPLDSHLLSQWTRFPPSGNLRMVCSPNKS